MQTLAGLRHRAPGATSSVAALWQALWRWFTAAMLLGWTSGCASLPDNVPRPASTAFAAPEQTALGQLVQARRSQAQARSDSGFMLLDNVEAAFTSRLALIERAQRTLDLQYYAIHADASTEVLLRGIREAARRGVRVRILLDDFNSVGADAQVLRLAFEPNVAIRLFNPLSGPRNSLVGRVVTSLHDVGRIQKRMHNKLFIADNAWGITGGRNLGDAYFGASGKHNFIDLDVLAAGRIVRDMSTSFDHYWNNELAYPVQALISPDELEALRKPLTDNVDPSRPQPAKPASAPAALPVTLSPSVLPSVTPTAVAQAQRAALDLTAAPLTWAPAALMVDKPGKIGPGDDEVNAGDTLIDGLQSLMSQAQRDILIVSPYVVPGARMMALYEQLRKRGVRIRMLTNSLASNDAPAAHAGYLRYRKALLDMGVELYEMRADPESSAELLGSRRASDTGGFGLGSGIGGPGGSKAGTHSRASLHSKAVIIDGRLSVIGSMNLDLRSQLKNSEVGLVIRSTALAAQATQQLEKTFASAAYRIEQRNGAVVWRAPPGAGFKDADSEPEATTRQKLLVRVLGPLAPDEML
jgi:phosphatidylserine/phosphatidylglycerophosphate/cardiolipin synthase-like enzyme